MTNEAVLEKKSYQQLWLRVILTFVSQFGSGLFSFSLALFIYDQTKSSISFGINMIAGPIAIVILTPFIGKIIDACSHKKVVVIAQLASILSMMFFIVFFSRFSDLDLLIFSFVIVMCLKVTDEFVLLTLFASSINFVQESHQTKLRAYQQIAADISQVIAPLLGGALFALVSFGMISGIELFSEILSLVIVFLLNFKLIQSPTEMEEGTTVDENKFLSTVKWLFKQKYLRSLVILSSVVNACDTIFYIAPPLIVLSIFKLDQIYYSVVSATMIVGQLLSGFIVAKRGDQEKPLSLLMILSFVTTALMIFLGVSGTFTPTIGFSLLVVALFLIPFLESFYNIPLQVWYVKEVPAKMQGKVFSFTGAVMMGTSPIATLIYSALYDIKSVNLVTLNLIIVAVVVAIKFSILIYYKFIKKLDFADAKINP